MISINADLVSVEDGDTVKLRFATPLVVDSKSSTAWPEGQKDVDTSKDRYEVRDQAWVRLPNLDAHESYTTAGDEETAALEGWMGTAEDEFDDGEYELEVFRPGSDVFEVGEYDRVLAKVARRSDGDDWETSALTKFGNAVAWREQTPK